MMRNTARLLAALLSLIAAPALAQNAPANSVQGRLGVPPGGGPVQSIPFRTFAAAFLASGLPGADFDFLRVTDIQNPATGHGLELGYDGTQGVLQPFSNRTTLARTPILHIATSHKFQVGASVKASINSVGLGIGAAAVIAPLDVRGLASMQGLQVYPVLNDTTYSLVIPTTATAPSPVAITWGTTGSPHLPSADSYVLDVLSFASLNSLNTTGLRVQMHRKGGAGGSNIGAVISAYGDIGWTGGSDLIGLDVNAINAVAGTNLWSIVTCVCSSSVALGQITGIELDVGSPLSALSKWLYIAQSRGDDTGTISNVETIFGGSGDTISQSAAFVVTGSGSGFAQGLQFVRSTASGAAAPVSANLIYGGGFTVPYGLNLGRMTFGQAAILLPNTSGTIKAFNAAGNAQIAMLSLNSSNKIALGAGATIDPTTGAMTIGGGNVRTPLAANTVLYVRTDGNDTNCTGLVNAAYVSGSYPQSCGFLTPQKAANIVYNTLDLNGFNVIVAVGNGTYGGVSITAPQSGMGTITFQGDTGTPSNVVLSATSAHAFGVTNGAAVTITGFKLQTTTSGNGLTADMGAQVTTGILQYGTSAGDHVIASHKAVIYVNGNEQIRGTASAHWHAGNGGHIEIGGINIDAAGGAYAFAAEFAGVSMNGTIFVLTGTNFTNTASITGQRYLAHTGGGISTQAVSLSSTYLPGNVAGIAYDDGFYNSVRFTDVFDVPATIRSTGITTPATGSGIEINFDGSSGIIQAIDHTGSVYLPMLYLAATSHTFRIAGTPIIAINSTGINYNGATSGAITLKALAIAGSNTLTLPAATDTLIGKATTDTLTNKTFDTAGTGNVFRVNAQQITGFSGAGNTVALQNSPGFITPSLGVATATSINFGGSALANYVSAGSWTPADGSGAGLSFSSVSANYTRIGNMVFAYGRVTYPVTASGSSTLISGLPITSANASYASTPCTIYSTNGNTNAHSGSVGVNATTFQLTKATGAATTNADVSNTVIIFHCMYPAT